MSANMDSQGKRPFRYRLRTVLQFSRNFVELTLLLSVGWWLLLPYYGYVLAQISGGILLNLLHVPIEAAKIEPGDAILNTASMLVFQLDGQPKPFPIALLITNMAPYLALVLATPGLRLLRRLFITVLGAAILFAGHVAFIVLAFYYRAEIAQAPSIPMAVAQFYLTLPFLLWVILAYWDRITASLSDDKQEQPERE